MINLTAHCANWYQTSSSDSAPLIAARQQVGSYVGAFLDSCSNVTNSTGCGKHGICTYEIRSDTSVNSRCACIHGYTGDACGIGMIDFTLNYDTLSAVRHCYSKIERRSLVVVDYRCLRNFHCRCWNWRINWLSLSKIPLVHNHEVNLEQYYRSALFCSSNRTTSPSAIILYFGAALYFIRG